MPEIEKKEGAEAPAGSETEGTENEGGDDQASIELEARSMGWYPKDKYKGDPKKWVDAKTFVQRGNEVLPIVRNENKKLRAEIADKDRQIAELKETTAANSEAIEALKEYNSKQNKDALKVRKTEVRKQLTQARKDENHELEAELEEQLEEISETLKESEKKPEQTAPARKAKDHTPKSDPVVEDWSKDNPWFGDDEERSQYALFLTRQFRAKGMPWTRETLDKVTEAVEKAFPTEPPKRGKQKMEGGGQGSRDNGGGGESKNTPSYNDLPPEAKTACDKFGKHLVGEGRAYKTQAEWRKKYAADYFGDSAA